MIQEYILRNWSMVMIGSTSAQRKLFFNLRRIKARLEEQNTAKLGDDISQEIATQLDVPIRDVVYMDGRLEKVTSLLNAVAFDESGIELQDLLADDRPNPEVILSGNEDAKIRADIISKKIWPNLVQESTV